MYHVKFSSFFGDERLGSIKFENCKNYVTFTTFFSVILMFFFPNKNQTQKKVKLTNFFVQSR